MNTMDLDFEHCQARLAKRHQFLFAVTRTRFPNDDGASHLASPRIRHPDGRRLGNGRMPMQNAFDFGRIDVFTAGFDHVFRPPVNVAVAIGVTAREIYSMKPTVWCDRFAVSSGLPP